MDDGGPWRDSTNANQRRCASSEAAAVANRLLDEYTNSGYTEQARRLSRITGDNGGTRQIRRTASHRATADKRLSAYLVEGEESLGRDEYEKFANANQRRCALSKTTTVANRLLDGAHKWSVWYELDNKS
ncbi:uncharacterized protein LOC116845819 [Odontomachus brunneus]|uniref:uncharacterized protein LOC116845819 n=1 Tax=Odontomachus brunneus TaxID=486640 RepID=UPI0013F24337|nr:uncharacterized protein LOC116845819 [Odontomachus brunneus]